MGRVSVVVVVVVSVVALDVVLLLLSNKVLLERRSSHSNNPTGSQLEVANDNLHSNLQTLMELWITGDTQEDGGAKEDDQNVEDGFASWSDDVRCAFLEVQLMIMKDYKRYCVRKRGSGVSSGKGRRGLALSPHCIHSSNAISDSDSKTFLTRHSSWTRILRTIDRFSR